MANVLAWPACARPFVHRQLQRSLGRSPQRRAGRRKRLRRGDPRLGTPSTRRLGGQRWIRNRAGGSSQGARHAPHGLDSAATAVVRQRRGEPGGNHQKGKAETAPRKMSSQLVRCNFHDQNLTMNQSAAGLEIMVLSLCCHLAGMTRGIAVRAYSDSGSRGVSRRRGRVVRGGTADTGYGCGWNASGSSAITVPNANDGHGVCGMRRNGAGTIP
jgi:hypothetical protein